MIEIRALLRKRKRGRNKIGVEKKRERGKKSEEWRIDVTRLEERAL